MGLNLLPYAGYQSHQEETQMNYVALFLATDGCTYQTQPQPTEAAARRQAQWHIRNQELVLMGPLVVTTAEEAEG